MCGIAGILKLNVSSQELSSQAEAMANAIEHRGPDSAGVWHSENYPVALSHRRLSILDLSPHGNQPMLSPNKQSVIAFNGEIYNFSKLKRKLEQDSYTFFSESDTEALLLSNEKYGVDETLKIAKGMFAFAHWDEHTGNLTLARDRIGEKPLYYGIIDNTFVFASELKSIYKLFPPKTLTLDKQAISSYLRYGYISAPNSVFEEIKKLPPGHKATINVKKWHENHDSIESHLKIERYWSIYDTANQSIKYQDNETKLALQDTDQLLNNIIEEQAISDVPLGSFLSGGIDSSLVTSVLQSQSKSPIETFTIGFHKKEFNEAVHAKSIASHLGTSHNELYLSSQDVLDVIPSIPAIYDEPFADASQIPTYLVSKFAKSKLTVCLSGDGGDELFAGYNRYTAGQKFQKISGHVPANIRKALAAVLLKIPPAAYNSVYALINTITRSKGGANFGTKIHKAAHSLNQHDAYQLYQFLCSYHQNPSTLLKHNGADGKLDSILSFNEAYMSAAMAWDQEWYLPGDNLVKSDRASMAVSLETRVPLLDKELIELAWQIPISMKWREGKSKWLLRQLLFRYVPEKLIERPKMGFSLPINHWLRHELKDWAEQLLSPTAIDASGVFNYTEVRKLWNEHLTGKVDNANSLWTLLMFQTWHSEYF